MSLVPTLFENELRFGNVAFEPEMAEKFNELKKELAQDETNLIKWDALFQLYQEKIEQGYEGEKKFDNEFKESVRESFEALLARFPYLTNYWKLWSIIQFKIDGVVSSMKVLERSVESHPFSLELWSDYLSALLSQYQSESSSIKLDYIRSQFNRAIELNGYQFSSHVIWDKIIAFETDQHKKEASFHLLDIYKKVINIPLYQYAQYYKQFTEINKDFPLVDILEEAELQEYLNKFEKQSAKELSLIEKHQIIDDYSYNIFTKIQTQVNIKWAFESALILQDFDIKSLQNPQEIEADLENWIKYLDHEIRAYTSRQVQDANSFDSGIVSLFERCLVPHCYNQKVWLKYLAFMNLSSVAESPKYESMKLVYTRATSKFVPLDSNTIRFNYAKFFLKHDQFDLANEYLLDLIRFFSGQSPKIAYLQQQYIESLDELLKIWQSSIPDFDTLVSKLVKSYFDENQEGDKRFKPDPKELHHLKHHHFAALSKLINSVGICLLVKYHLQSIPCDAHGVLKIRTFYNMYHKQRELSTSVFFWNFYLEFEGIGQHNMANFLMIIYYIKTQTQLPKAIIDTMIEFSYDIVCANMSSIKKLNLNSDDILLSKDSQISNSLVENAWARKRISASKSRSGYHPINKDEEVMRILRKHIANPGIFIEATPDITNKLLKQGNWVDLNSPNLAVPPFPTFKNVEKASLPVHYPSD